MLDTLRKYSLIDGNFEEKISSHKILGNFREKFTSYVNEIQY